MKMENQNTDATIREVAGQYNIPAQDLLKQIILANVSGKDAIHSLARDIKKRLELFPRKVRIDRLEKETCELRPLNWRQAKSILTNLHYLRSYRRHSIHLGLYSNSLLLGLMTLSPYDFFFHPYQVFSQATPKEVLNVSRIYLFDYAPRNTMSFFLSRGVKYIRRNIPRVKMLTTVANPNLGHAGSSYRAANWNEVAQFMGAPRFFLDGKPITHRGLAESAKTLNIGEIKRIYKSRLFLAPTLPLPQRMFFLPVQLQKKTTAPLYYFCGTHLCSACGMTGPDPSNAISTQEASLRIKAVHGDIIAGYLQKNDDRATSSLLIKNKNSIQHIHIRNLPIIARFDSLGNTMIASALKLNYLAQLAQANIASVDTLVLFELETREENLLLHRDMKPLGRVGKNIVVVPLDSPPRSISAAL